MKVLRIIARLNVGGPARHVTLLNAGLNERGHETLLVHGAVGDGEASLERAAADAGIRTIRLEALGRRIALLGDLLAFAAVFRIIATDRPDVVHTHTAKAGTIGRLAAALFNIGRPRRQRCLIVHTFHGHVFDGYFSPVGSAAVRFVERRLAALTHRIVAISPTQRRDLAERFAIAPEKKIATISLGLDLEPLFELAGGESRLRQRLGFASEEIVIGWAGRMVPIKDLRTLVHAFDSARRKVPGLRLLLAGDGPERPAIEALVRDLDLGSQTTFLGWTDDLPGLYAAIDIAALTSRNEGTPVSLIEAMAAARPVVATAVGGVPDVVADGVTGLLAASGDPEDIARALVRLAMSPELRRHLGEEGRRRAREYTPQRLVEEIERLYDEGLAAIRGPQLARSRA